MLATMLAYCSSGMEQSIMFQYRFLQHLPATLRTLLGEQESGDTLKPGGQGRPWLWATHKQQSQDLVASVEMAEEQPAAQIVSCCP